MQVPDETGSLEPLGAYRNRTIMLTLPAPLDLQSVSWFSIWSQSLQSSFADISIPSGLPVPPASAELGLGPQVHSGP